MATVFFEGPKRTIAQQTDDFVKDSPQLQAMLKADQATPRKRGGHVSVTRFQAMMHSRIMTDWPVFATVIFPDHGWGWTLRPLRR